MDRPVRESQTLITETLARTRLFADWPELLRTRLSAASSLRRLPDGEMILRMGAPTDSMVVVASGSLSVQRSLKNGKTIVFDFLLPGQSTGHLAILDGLPAAFDVLAKGDAEVILIPREAIMGIIGRDPERLFEVIQFLCRRTRIDYEGTHAKTGNTLRCQLAKLLIYWARGPSVPQGFEIPVALSQDDLAALTGRSRQTINREITALAREGVLAHRYRKIHLLDVPRLAQIIDDEDPGMPEMREALFARPKSMFNATD